jgi:hypothetical protein
LCHWFNTWYQSKIRIGKPFQQEEIEEVAHDTTRGVKVTTKIVDYFFFFSLFYLTNGGKKAKKRDQLGRARERRRHSIRGDSPRSRRPRGHRIREWKVQYGRSKMGERRRGIGAAREKAHGRRTRAFGGDGAEAGSRECREPPPQLGII